MQIYTIGHSNLIPEKFLNLLAKVKIEVLADVRSNPNSRWSQWANRDSLSELLNSVQIRYIYLGDVLGGHPADPDSYDPRTGQVDYRRIQQQEYYKRGIKQLLEKVKESRVCVMCAEEDPASCHRNLLIGESLRQQGITVLHIRGDGRIQTDEEVWKEKAGMPINQYSLPL